MIIFFNQLLLSETMIGGEFNNASARGARCSGTNLNEELFSILGALISWS